MNIYQNMFMGYTTIIVELETENDKVIGGVREILDDLGNRCHCECNVTASYAPASYSKLTAGEEYTKIWRFTVLSQETAGYIEKQINELTEIVLAQNGK